MEGTNLTKQEKELKVADEFDRFTTIQSNYTRFTKWMNDINIIGLEMIPLQVNTKFVNHLQPEWSRFVIGVKLAKNLHQVSFDQLYAYLKQNEPYVNEVCAIKARFPDPLALIVNTNNPPPYYSSYKSQYNPRMPVAAQKPYIPQPSYEPPVVYQQPYVVYQQPPVIYQQPPIVERCGYGDNINKLLRELREDGMGLDDKKWVMVALVMDERLLEEYDILPRSWLFDLESPKDMVFMLGEKGFV
ncbi:hypothetical protein Tco_0110002 [Tanacetum coccineum]